MKKLEFKDEYSNWNPILLTILHYLTITGLHFFTIWVVNTVILRVFESIDNSLVISILVVWAMKMCDALTISSALVEKKTNNTPSEELTNKDVVIKKRKTLFITIEGPDGAGKTTIINGLNEWLEMNGYDFILTREPGGIEIAEQIRNVILDTKNTEMDPITEALLYAAARRQHLVQRVIPALRDDKIVLCDRFIDSSLAYQGVGRGLGVDEILQVNKFAIRDVMPDLTLLLMLSPEEGLERINKNRNDEVNRLDLETLEFHKSVHQGYSSLADRFPDRIKVVDASNSVEEVLEDAIKILEDFLKEDK